MEVLWVKRLVAGVVAAYLLFAVSGRLVEAVGAVSCAGADNWWCHKPTLSMFRWVFPWPHRSHHG